MDHLPSDDRRITGGAVAAAWAMVAGLTAVTVLASAIAPPKPRPLPLTEQASLHVMGCPQDEPIDDGPDPSLRD